MPDAHPACYALTPLQEGMLFHHLQEPDGGVDIEQIVIDLPERIDPARLEQAWRWLVARHDILRTRFLWDSPARPRQEVVPGVTVPFVFEDQSGLEARAQEEHFHLFLESDRTQGFAMDAAPLLRVRLLRFSAAGFRLVWSFHHALLDGRCFPTLLQELFAAYEELPAGAPRSRPVPGPFRDHVEWLQRQNFSEADAFWRKTLAGFTAPTPLVVARTIAAGDVVPRRGEAWEILDASSTARLRALADGQAVTMNAIVMGAWAVLLHRYSGEPEIVFGATRACRKSSVAGADEIIGPLINTVPVRVRLSGDDGVLGVIKALRQQWLDIRPHEHAPLARIKSVSRVPPALSLFETLVVFEGFRLDTRMKSLGGAWSARSVQLHELTNFPVTLAAYDGPGLSLKIEYDRRRLDDATVARLLGHLRRLLQGIASAPGATVASLPLVGEEERRELIHDFNRTARLPASRHLPVDGGSTLSQLFEAQAARRPGAAALTCDGRSLTYAQLNAQANRLARELVRHGVKPDTLVGLCLERGNELVIALLAILKAGGAYLPIDLAYPAERLAFMLEDAQAPVLLTQSQLVATLPPTQATVICVDEILAQPARAGDEANLAPTAGPDHLAYVIYTSGTTGQPKGSLITHRNVVRLFPATEHWYGFGEQDVWTLFHSSAFDFSVWEIWGALLYGGRVVVVPFLVSRSPEAFYELLASEQVTVLNQTPSAFRQLIQAEEVVGQKPLALRYVIFGGEALEMQSLRPWFERHGDQQPRLVNMYGITETTVHVTYRLLSKDDLGSGSVIGVPIPDLQIYLLDPRLQPVPIGVPGEMYVGGAGLARGYLRRPELTAGRFIPDHLSGRAGARLYRTGDLARFLPGRDIEYLGRIDHQVKIRGFRIELGEIESVLCQHPAVREAIVLTRGDSAGGKRLVGYVAVTPPAPPVTELREHLRKKLPDYMVPAVFVFLDKLPLTNNGKIDRQALPEPEPERPDLAAAFVAPRNATETKLAEIWSQVLRIERVGVHDNFFEIGGDSILSIQIISLARQAGLKLSPKLLFQHQTIAELAAAAAPAAETPGAQQDLVSGRAPLTPIQHWFFEQEMAEPHYYNQAFLFTVKERLDLPALTRALQGIERQHDALRLRFASLPRPDEQAFTPAVAPAAPESVDLSSVPEGALAGAIETVATRAQASLDCQQGPLWRTVLFDCGPRRPARLFVAIHHLAVDGVSWRILLEDLEKAYRQELAGQPVKLPPKTTSVKEWAERLGQLARNDGLPGDAEYWRQAPAGPVGSLPLDLEQGENTEASARTVTVSLTEAETAALLLQAPAAYNTQINDLLLAALAPALAAWTGAGSVDLLLEGHGREDLFEAVDLSRTVGWFTAIYPVRLELPAPEPAALIKSVKEQLRAVPTRGIGYGLQRYLRPGQPPATGPEPKILFNYLGQFDQVTAGSGLFAFADEPVGPWHSPRNRRRYLFEINCLVRHGRFELTWTYSENRHRPQTVGSLAAAFLARLRGIIAHCTTAGVHGATPSDFPWAALDQEKLDGLLARIPDLEDVCQLSPIQTLFYTAGAHDSRAVLDHWHGTLTGPLDRASLAQAWQSVFAHHAILRTSFQSAGLKEALQVVHRSIQLPWRDEDWRGLDAGRQATRWNEFLQTDRAEGLALDQAPLSRVALVRLDETRYKFLWSVPALLLDGWSWPLVFRDLAQAYDAHRRGQPVALEPARRYRDYVAWGAARRQPETDQFWREALRGFTEPTPLRAGAAPAGGGTRAEWTAVLDASAAERLPAFARQLQVTPGAVIQAAWALVLARLSGQSDIVFGAAFAGRPTDLPGAEGIVGPFVNNLPIRVRLDGKAPARAFLQEFHARLLQLNPHQFAPLAQIQALSEVPWRHRLFDSLVVVQNYLVDDSARGLGADVVISDFTGPIHTSFPLLVLVEPRSDWRISLIYDPRLLPAEAVQRWGGDLVRTLSRLPAPGEATLDDLLGQLSPPDPATSAKRSWRVQSLNYVPPQSDLERQIAGIWEEMLQLERISVEENIFDLGVHSLLATRLHLRVCEAVGQNFALVAMFQYPTIQSLAKHLGRSNAAEDRGAEFRTRADRQRGALAQLRSAGARRQAGRDAKP